MVFWYYEIMNPTEMPEFDFDHPADRRGTSSFKWDLPGMDKDVLPLWVADMDFAAPPGVVRALLDRAAHGVYGYTFAPEGLFEAFIDWQWKKNRFKVERDWIVFAPGVVPSLHYALDAYAGPGDGVVVQPPVYRPFYRAVEVTGRRLVLNPLRDTGLGYEMDFDALEAAAAGVKVLILCNPHNPVARVWTGEELERLGEICVKNDIVVVSDDIHSDLVLPGHPYVPLANIRGDFAARTVTCFAPSKTFNIPGTGCAFIVIPDPALRAAFRKAGERTAALDGTNLFSAAAAEAAYRTGGPWLEALVPYIRANYDFLKNRLAQRIPSVRVYPLEGTYVAWLDFRSFRISDEALENLLLREAKVKLNGGPIFGPGGEGFQRINLACPRNILEEALRRMAGVFEKGIKS
jgi:cystathionine beta-lyase